MFDYIELEENVSELKFFHELVMNQRCCKVLYSYILKLDPVLLLTQECLMNYLLDEKKKTKSSVRNMKELYRQANILLILIGGKETIIQFSMPIIDIFGRQEDQLIGHPIQTLFHDEHFRLFSNIRHRIAGMHYIKLINPNDQDFSIRVNVTPIGSNVLL